MMAVDARSASAVPPAVPLTRARRRGVGRDRRSTLTTVEGAGVESEGVAARFRDGDPDAVRDLYRLYGRTVYGVAFRALGDRSLAEEAVQQTFLQAWRAAATVDPSRDVAPWLFTITRRVAIDLYRKESRRRHDAFPDVHDGDTPEATIPPAIEGLSERWEIRSAVDALPDDEREVVRLQHFAGLTHVEIAGKLDVPVGTVKSRSFRAHKRLAVTLRHLQGVS